MRRAVVGVLAHVDAGKTTLSEALLYQAGAVRARGSVDAGSSHLDTAGVERERGITVYSAQATLEHDGTELTFVDTPGHVDFAAEAERVLPVLDLAVLVIAGNDGVQGHTHTLWQLLERYGVPAVVFVNKMDLATADRAGVLAQMRARLGAGCLDFSDVTSAELHEECATLDETALDEFLEKGELSGETLCRLVRARKAFPCLFGSAARGDGVGELLDALALLAREHAWPDEFGARVYKVSHDERGERLVWLKVTGGALHVKDVLEGVSDGRAWSQKVNQIRRYAGVRYELAGEADAGEVCAVTGLASVCAGDGLGADTGGGSAVLEPVLSYRVLPGACDVHAVYEALRVLTDEDPLLRATWDEQLQEVRVQLMGPVQLEVVRDELERRFGLDVGFGPGGILYRETISQPCVGMGHFEPLRHYAEVHLLLEPLPRGSGVAFGTVCPEDDLDRNWQRLILTNAMERPHKGVLTGVELTDVRITVVAGRAHAKHTEGGDFRQATYRAIRQGLMEAREAGVCVLLEPWYRFRLEVPQDKVGRAMADLQRMCAEFVAPAIEADFATLEGAVPASELGDYAVEVSAYTAGRGHLFCVLDGYRECHDAERVIAEAAYDPEGDLSNTPDSVFCAHGAGYTVKWHDVPAHAHVTEDPSRRTPWRDASTYLVAQQGLSTCSCWRLCR